MGQKSTLTRDSIGLFRVEEEEEALYLRLTSAPVLWVWKTLSPAI